MGQIASMLVPLGAQLIGGKPAVPNESSAGLNTAGSAYDLNSNDTAASLIGGFSTNTLLIGGGILLAAILLWKKL